MDIEGGGSESNPFQPKFDRFPLTRITIFIAYQSSFDTFSRFIRSKPNHSEDVHFPNAIYTYFSPVLRWKTKQVNVVCTIVNGKPVYEIIRPIAAHQELVVYYLPDQERPKELFYAHMRSILNRRTMDSILEVLEGKLSHFFRSRDFVLKKSLDSIWSSPTTTKFIKWHHQIIEAFKFWPHHSTFDRKTGNSA